MLISDLMDDEFVNGIMSESLDEGFVQMWKKSKRGTPVKKYKCTSGKKKGRVVSHLSTCSSPVKKHKMSHRHNTHIRKSFRKKHS